MKTAKKPNIPGSVYFERLDRHGLRVYRMEVPRGGKGVPPARERVHVRNDAEAYSALRAFGKRIAQEQDTPPAPVGAAMLFQTWAACWLQQRAAELDARTLDGYREHLQLRILPYFSGMPIGDITADHVKQWLARIGEPGGRLGRDRQPIAGACLSTATVKKYLATLRGCLADAVYAGLLPANPVSGARAPRVRKLMPRYYTPDEMTRLLANLHAMPLRVRAIILLLIASGLRRGEVIALEWSDIDLHNRTITVRQAAQSYRKRLGPQHTKRPKSAAGNRTIPIMLDEAVDALREWKAYLDTLPETSAQRVKGGHYICTNRQGWLTPDWLTRLFTTFVREHGLPPLTLHGLRHSFATLMLSRGIPVNQVQLWLGHSSPVTTYTHYAHAIPGFDQAGRTAMQQALTPKNPPKTPATTP